ncbi:DUF3883 domain-containing protein [Prolixibacter denitrificans]|uniref:Uncharacterized protein DUF3883 n=1 Tax=Prolixibacter denitrificans TaxID=1541063 RepID=A0A2P8C5F7_9BACT|nr:DUF3883 domain-containing protein [Prolixibacter denitrificans]PSK80188.1 uncharacterized protein DUF3883 [Prolixibacter denitrificans]GET22383.1 hypothetical protein JCM18694_26290 [Prolixibacter denitrificans]
MSESWSVIEVELTVADYFKMLVAELNGIAYNKSAYRRALLSFLDQRTESAVEKKRQNISAALVKLGQPYIKGYLPLFNYQQLVEEKVVEYLKDKPELELLFRSFANKEIQQRGQTNFEKLLEAAPEPEKVHEPQTPYIRKPIKVNYLEQEQKNHSLGMHGEELVMDWEKWNLKKEGKSRYADEVRWVSREEGDGLGYDILSKDLAGKDKFIEVKTTKLSKKTPIYFSKNELDFSVSNKEKFYLYRLFNFEKSPKMFIRQGALNQACLAEPINYRGYF